MFIVLVRRCQEVWPIGRHGQMTSERETKQFGCPSLLVFPPHCQLHQCHYYREFCGRRLLHSSMFSLVSLCCFLMVLSISGWYPSKK